METPFLEQPNSIQNTSGKFHMFSLSFKSSFYFFIYFYGFFLFEVERKQKLVLKKIFVSVAIVKEDQ